MSIAQRILRRFLAKAAVPQTSGPSSVAQKIAARFRQAFEHTSPEELHDYLHQHPGADPANHWVQQKDDKAPKSEDKPEKPEAKPEDETKGEAKPKEKLEVPHSKPMARPKEQARVGVAGKEVPPPPKNLPRLANLRDDEKLYEEEMNDIFEANPEGAAKKFSTSCEKDNWCFETDAAKNLLPEWSRDDLPPDEKNKVNPERAEFRGKYNAVLHQAANAIAKRAFVSRLDEIAKLPEDKRKVLVTSGGVAAGKGSALKAQPDLKKSASATWDAAGEQNATENEWVLEECKKRGIRASFLFVHADPKKSWPGVVERAKSIGRMVDAQLFADSYAVGAKNFADFHEKHKGEADFVFGVFQGKETPAQIVPSMPEEATKLDADDIYEFASKYMDEKKSELPAYIYDGATIGRRAFKGESDKTASTPYVIMPRKAVRVMASPKVPPADEKELARIRKLFEKGLNEAAQDPDKMNELRIKSDQLVTPWEDYVKGWNARKQKIKEIKEKEKK
jgi:hypothetical protein